MNIHQELRLLLEDCDANHTRPVLLLVPRAYKYQMTALEFCGQPVPIRHVENSVTRRLTMMSRYQ
jgi:hypothetical protein